MVLMKENKNTQKHLSCHGAYVYTNEKYVNESYRRSDAIFKISIIKWKRVN